MYLVSPPGPIKRVRPFDNQVGLSKTEGIGLYFCKTLNLNKSHASN